MLCSRCQNNPIDVHVIEIAPDAVLGCHGEPEGISEVHLCSDCAKSANLPHKPVVLKKTPAEIWDLLQSSARKARAGGQMACPQCKLSLQEFRKRGRLGCPKCYEVFGKHLQELLERIHGSTQHVGRIPGLPDAELDRQEQVNELEKALEVAIREEAYESAARIRDQIKGLGD